MRLLLDTHALLGFALADPVLPARVRRTIADPANAVFVSPASYWEIAIKAGTGRYTLPGPHAAFFEAVIADNGFHILPIEPRHTETLLTLPPHHKDPFDRLLIAQAVAEGLTLVSDDAAVRLYPVPVAW